ncbi:MAG: metallophosphoesterase, partial [Clostridia bacterium]|nr:metallophosphoesterase [Clostridia bacterium]
MITWQEAFIKEFMANKGEVDIPKFVDAHDSEIKAPNRLSQLKQVYRVRNNCQSGNITKYTRGKKTQQKNVKKPTTEKIYESVAPVIVEGHWEHETTITFGLMGDTQLGSKYAQLTYLNQFYDVCERMGVKDVYHTGDISDGDKMRPGHEYDLYAHGADEHIADIVKNYPMRPGITTHFITGNHDAAFRKLCGMDIGDHIANRRSDMDYLGRDFAIVNITPEVTLMLRHPWDGSAYALSYRPQKMIEAMDEDTRPTIMGIGHYHKMEYLYYLGVHCFQTGCFQ